MFGGFNKNSLSDHSLQVDIVDFNGSFLTRVRDLVGSNPIILVVTKVHRHTWTFMLPFLYGPCRNT